MASLEEQKGSTYLCFLIMAAAGPEGMAWRCVREGHIGHWERVFHQRVEGTAQAAGLDCVLRHRIEL